MPTLWELACPFVFGGISGCTATTCVQPMDTLKVRIQVSAEQRGQGNTAKFSPFSLAKDIFVNEGPAGFYRGYDISIK